MTFGVVIGLKSVDIEHNQRQRSRLARRSPPFLVQKVIELTSIGDTRQSIQAGKTEQHLIGFLELTHDLKEFLLPGAAAVYFVDKPEHRPYSGQELDLVDRFGDVIHGSGGKRKLKIDRIRLDGDHNDRGISEPVGGLYLPTGFDA